jgi:hypothetical protein
VTLAHGPAAYLLSAGAGLDVVGLRSWQLPPDMLGTVTAAHPRLGFKREFIAAFRAEAAGVPRRAGRVPAPVRSVRPGHQGRSVLGLSTLIAGSGSTGIR